jgi:uncharacterized protein YodC (DUF2158 family)
MHEEFNPGDCVQLKSGAGPVMCVLEVEHPPQAPEAAHHDHCNVSTVWFTTDHERQTSSFPSCVLKCSHHQAKKAAKK